MGSAWWGSGAGYLFERPNLRGVDARFSQPTIGQAVVGVGLRSSGLVWCDVVAKAGDEGGWVGENCWCREWERASRPATSGLYRRPKKGRPVIFPRPGMG